MIITGLMMMKSNVKEIIKYLDKIIPEPWCELNFNSDYELLIAIVLSAQTTDKRVNIVTKKLFGKYNSLEELSKADISCIEEILKSLGTYHKKAVYVSLIAKELLNKYNGIVPVERNRLEALSGVGRKTASVFLCEYYNYPEFAVDTHVLRVSRRLKLVNEDDNVIIVENKLKEVFSKEEWGKRHKQFVLFGRYYCKAVKPKCENCELSKICKEKKV